MGKFRVKTALVYALYQIFTFGQVEDKIIFLKLL